MATTDPILDINPAVDAVEKGYEDNELASLIGYIDQTIVWMQTYGMHLPESEDVAAIRVGVPYFGTDTTIDSQTIYTSDDNLDRLITTLSVDFIKFTAKDPTKPVKYQQQSFNYKSDVIHRVLGELFIPGVNNKTGYTYLDNFVVSPSQVGSMLVEYDGIPQLPPVAPDEVPDYVLKCVTYLAQNPGLLNDTTETLDDEYVPKGAIEYYKVKDLFDMLVSVKYKAENKLPTVSEEDLPLAREAAIKYILEDTGIDQGFTDLDYGGTLEGIRVFIRIPASRENQDTLESLLGKDDVFEDVFKTIWVSLDGNDASENAKKDHYADIYSTEVGDYPLDDVANGYYGCANSSSYRHWMVEDEWLQTITPEKLSIIFWMGLDLDMFQNVPNCVLDKILITIAVIVITYLSWGTAGTTAAAVGNAMLVASAIVAIGTTWGVIDAKKGKQIGLILSILSLGGGSAAGAIGNLGFNAPTLALTMQVANLGLSVANYLEDASMEDTEDEMARQQAEIDAGPERFASDLRLTFGSEEFHIRNGCEANLEEPLTKPFVKYSSFQHIGFRNG